MSDHVRTASELVHAGADITRTEADALKRRATSVRGITAALVEFQSILPKIDKKSTAYVRSEKGNFKYDYADLSDVSAVVLPALAAVGIAYTASLRARDNGGFVLVARLRHVSGESIKCEWPVQPAAAQQMGSAITYGRRYCLLAMSGVHPAGEDDDGAAASTRRRDEPRLPEPRPLPQTSDTPPDPLLIDPKDVGKLWRLMKRADMTEEDVARNWMGSVLGIPADQVSTKALTKVQASILFAELKLLIGRGATRTRPTEPAADQWTVDTTTGEVLINVDDGQQS